MKLKIEKEEHTNKTFRLNKKLVNQMEKICDTKGISFNKLVDICVRYAIENLETDDEQKS